MLRLKYVVIIKANPGILKHGDGINRWMWLCVERESYLGFGMGKIGRNIVGQKKHAKRVVYMAMNQKARETVEKVGSCRDGRELFRISKKKCWGEERCCWV